MRLRVKEICKENNITLAEVASRLHISPVTLSQSLNGNPTLSRLQEVAEILDVDISDLFAKEFSNLIHGCIYVNGKANLINSKSDLEELLRSL